MIFVFINLIDRLKELNYSVKMRRFRKKNKNKSHFTLHHLQKQDISKTIDFLLLFFLSQIKINDLKYFFIKVYKINKQVH